MESKDEGKLKESQVNNKWPSIILRESWKVKTRQKGELTPRKQHVQYASGVDELFVCGVGGWPREHGVK